MAKKSVPKLGGFLLTARTDVPDFRDYIYEPALIKLKAKLEVPDGLKIRHQGQSNACTGFGLAACAEIAQEYAGIDLDGARVAVQGFGSVGQHAARFLAERGARLVAAADSRGTVVDPSGLDIDSLMAKHRNQGPLQRCCAHR